MADSTITALTEIPTPCADDDMFVVDDTSATLTKRVQRQNIVRGGANAATVAGGGGTETLTLGANLGSVLSGYAQATAGLTALLESSGKGSFATGYVKVRGTIKASGPGAMAQGQVTGSASYSPTIQAVKEGAQSRGLAVGNALIDSNGYGTMAGGYAGSASATQAKIRVTGDGNMAFGTAQLGGTLTCYGHGGFAFGGSKGAYCRIRAGYGGFAGSFAFAYARGTGTCYVEAKRYGSLAVGFASTISGTAKILVDAKGAMAHGVAYDNGASLRAIGVGSRVFGYAYAVEILASAYGAMAGGYAITNGITASGKGSIAWGRSSAAAIAATADNSFQFGPGTNALANSLSIGARGSGVRICGGGAPAGPSNGDIWVASNYVYIRTNGTSKKIV